MRISGGGQAPEEIQGLRSCRDGGTRHNNRERFLVFEITLAMTNDRVLWALSRRHCVRNCIAEMMVTACEPALVPDSQQRLSEHTIFPSIHRNLVVLTGRDQDRAVPLRGVFLRMVSYRAPARSL